MAKQRNKPDQVQAEGDVLNAVDPIGDLIALTEEPKTEPPPASEEDAPPPQPGQPGHPMQMMSHWAQQHGHIPRKGPIRFPGDIHRGPHLAVVLADSKLAASSLVTEARYLAAVARAYSHSVG